MLEGWRMPCDEPLEIGKIVNTHGLKGEVKVTPWCDDSRVFLSLDSVQTKNNRLKIENVKFFKNTVIIKFSGINSIEDAEKMRNEIIYADRSQLAPLADGTYYIRDIIGLEVFEKDTRMGIIEDCFDTGSNDVYVVLTDEGRRILIPAISQFVKKVDIRGKRMEVVQPEYED
jgi:16S rRNA processing protein RimM